MSAKLFLPLEQAKQFLNLSLADKSEDQNVLNKLISAQFFVQTYIRRQFDGEVLLTKIHSGNDMQSLPLNNFPIRSISELNIDSAKGFSAATIISSSDYSIQSDYGLLTLLGGLPNQAPLFPMAEDNIQVKYYAGWISEKTVVAAAVKNASHTIADNLLTYGQPFSIFVKTLETFTAIGAGISITGLDENGNSISESLVPYAAETSSKIPTISYATNKFTKITAVDSSALTGAGTISITAVSMPGDLREAILLCMARAYRRDKKASVGVRTRSTQNTSESYEPSSIPTEAVQILDYHKALYF